MKKITESQLKEKVQSLRMALLKEAPTNPYTGADAERFNALTPQDQQALTKGGQKPDINDQFILGRLPNKGRPAAGGALPAGSPSQPLTWQDGSGNTVRDSSGNPVQAGATTGGALGAAASAAKPAPEDNPEASMGAGQSVKPASPEGAPGAQDDATGVDAAVAAQQAQQGGAGPTDSEIAANNAALGNWDADVAGAAGASTKPEDQKTIDPEKMARFKELLDKASGSSGQAAKPETAGGAAPAAGGAAPAAGGAKQPWQAIYDMNKDVIGPNPNLIKPGQKLKMPDGSTYTVKAGDSLSKIAAGSKSGQSTRPAPAAPAPLPGRAVPGASGSMMGDMQYDAMGNPTGPANPMPESVQYKDDLVLARIKSLSRY